MNVKYQIQQVAEDRAQNCFTNDYVKQTPQEDREAEGLGIALAQWAEWDGLKLMRVFYAALEDANFHTEAGMVQAMIEALD